MEIKLTYRSCDGCRKRKTFKTLNGAQKYAQTWVGVTPEMGSYYAVSGDGIGRISDVEGCALIDLFPVVKADREAFAALQAARS